MYGRGARVLTQPALSTAPGVGPGTYRVENGGKHPGGIYVLLQRHLSPFFLFFFYFLFMPNDKGYINS